MEKELMIKDDVLSIAKELDDLKGDNTVALDISKESSWTSYFIITTCSSNAHLRGIVDVVRMKIHELGYSIKQNRKNPGRQGWVLLDCGDFIIHLMDKDSREFYELEERWFNSETIYSSSSSKLS